MKRRDWLSKADEILKNSSGKNNSGNKIAGESRRRRKKRLWLERNKTRKISDDGNKKTRENDQCIVYVGDWAYLPDLVPIGVAAVVVVSVVFLKMTLPSDLALMVVPGLAAKLSNFFICA